METQINTTHITADDQDFWTCVCGNQPDRDGFYPCDESGNQVEPTPEEWKKPLYVCAACGRIIDQETLAVVGRDLHPMVCFSHCDFRG